MAQSGKNQKSLPVAVTQAKLKQGDAVFCHKNNIGTEMDGQEGSVHSK